MERSAGAATTVLESLRLLYDSGADRDLPAEELLARLETIGVRGFTTDQAPYFLFVGTMLRMLLKETGQDPGHPFRCCPREARRAGP